MKQFYIQHKALKNVSPAWGRVQFSITLLSDSKSLEMLQPGAASIEAGPRGSTSHGLKHRESVKSDFVHLSLDLRKPSFCEEQNPWVCHEWTVPRHCSCLSSTPPSPKLPIWEPAQWSCSPWGGIPRGICHRQWWTLPLHASPQLQDQRSALRAGPFLRTSNSACLSRKETCRNPHHSHAHLFRLLKECLFPSVKATRQLFFFYFRQVMTCLSYCTNHQGTNFKSNESYTSLLLQGIEL